MDKEDNGCGGRLEGLTWDAFLIFFLLRRFFLFFYSLFPVLRALSSEYPVTSAEGTLRVYALHS